MGSVCVGNSVADHDAFPIDMKAPREDKAGIGALLFNGGVAFV